MNNFRRFIVLKGLTFSLLVGAFTTPVFAQPQPEQPQGTSTVAPAPVVVYKFPQITYSTAGTFDYKGKHFQGDEIKVLDSDIGKQVTITTARGVDTFTTFTLLLPNNPIQNNAKITAVGITTSRVVPRPGTTSYTLLHGTVSIKK
ncbi:hypothetical protein N0Y54_33425 [Nostoc punctiforme UO1]|uniref:hypothetical protein n=1 Tax=Nostoc punctiforme TaxID=272131 RepID=UPI003096E5DB